jgi:hypothetical protein
VFGAAASNDPYANAATLAGTSTMDPRTDEMTVTYERYELAGMEEYSGVRARLYAKSANDCESMTTTCPIPTEASEGDCSASGVIVWAKQINRLDDGGEGSGDGKRVSVNYGLRQISWLRHPREAYIRLQKREVVVLEGLVNLEAY